VYANAGATLLCAVGTHGPRVGVYPQGRHNCRLLSPSGVEHGGTAGTRLCVGARYVVRQLLMVTLRNSCTTARYSARILRKATPKSQSGNVRKLVEMLPVLSPLQTWVLCLGQLRV